MLLRRTTVGVRRRQRRRESLSVTSTRKSSAHTTTATTTTVLWLWALTSISIGITSTSVITSLQGVNGQACTSCYRGAAFLSAAPQPLCSEQQAKVSGLFGTDNDCKDLQLLNFQYGCCSSPPIEYCSYCSDPNIEPNMDAIVPTGQFADPYSCYDYRVQNEAYLGMFQDGTCDDTFLRRAGHYCGCGPAQVQQCWLCPDQQPPTLPQKTDAWITNANCRGVEYLFSLLTEEECTTLPYTAGADLAIYCGCNGLNQTAIDEQAALYQCNFCENDGGYVTNPDTVYTTSSDPYPKTCQQAEDFARDIIKTPAGCRNTNFFGPAREICTCYGSDSTQSSSVPPSPVLVPGHLVAVLFSSLFVTVIMVSSLLVL